MISRRVSVVCDRRGVLFIKLPGTGIHEGEAEIFLWELFTTKPSFRSGELKYVRVAVVF